MLSLIIQLKAFNIQQIFNRFYCYLTFIHPLQSIYVYNLLYLFLPTINEAIKDVLKGCQHNYPIMDIGFD
jgi:hypothetical protein